MPKYFVYELLDEHGTPFYVGKGSGNRISGHFREGKASYNQAKQDIIQDMLSRGIEVKHTKVGFYDSERDALDAEKALIIKYGRRGLDEGGILTNVAVGFSLAGSDNGMFGKNHTADSKKLISEQRKANPYIEPADHLAARSLAIKTAYARKHMATYLTIFKMLDNGDGPRVIGKTLNVSWDMINKVRKPGEREFIETIWKQMNDE